MKLSNALGLRYLKDFKPMELDYLCKKAELVDMAKALEIKSSSSMKKLELAEAIIERLDGIVWAILLYLPQLQMLSFRLWIDYKGSLWGLRFLVWGWGDRIKKERRRWKNQDSWIGSILIKRLKETKGK